METLLLVVTVACVLIASFASMVVWTQVHEARERSAVRVEALRSLALDDGVPAMFGASVEQGAPTRRWIAVAAVAAVMLSIAGTVFAVHKTQPTIAVRAPEQTLELLTLKETTDRHGAFVVSGEVRNSSRTQSLQGVAAFVDLYDRSNQFVGGQKTPLQALAPGEASSFTMSLPKTAGVARYRVQFRRADGSLLPHLDRRAPGVVQTAERTEHDPLE
jgi:hypothetical protein